MRNKVLNILLIHIPLCRLVNIIIAVYFKGSFNKINDAYRLVVTHL